VKGDPGPSAASTATDSPSEAIERTGVRHVAISDLRGLSQLIVQAVGGATDIVESMHRNIARVSPLVGSVPAGRTRGIAGLVYRSVRGVARSVGFAVDMALSPFAPASTDSPASPQREAVLAALNGVLGDHLVRTGNRLAIPMRLRVGGHALVLQRSALTDRFPHAGGRVLVLAHGLCMNDLQWRRDGHDHGAALADALGYTPLYLHYNTGCSISSNGRAFANLLEELSQAWPVPISELCILGHSMGGLVARSAFRHGTDAGHGWTRMLGNLVFLGTPHHGAPLERLGSHVDMLLGISPYTAPLARLGGIRSAGIQDLRNGNVAPVRRADPDSDTENIATDPPLPDGVRCFAVAATRQKSSGSGQRLRSDGLVPVASAFGQSSNPVKDDLEFPESRRYLCYHANHFDLLSRADICEEMREWLA
jgi:hypothetical protein